MIMNLSGGHTFFKVKKEKPLILNEICFGCNKTINESFQNWRLEQLAIKADKDIPSHLKMFYLSGMNVEKNLKKYYFIYKKTCPHCDSTLWLCESCNDNYNSDPPEKCLECGESFKICPKCGCQNKTDYPVCSFCGMTKKGAEKSVSTGSDSSIIVVGLGLIILGIVILIFSYSDSKVGVFIAAIMILGGIGMIINQIIKSAKVSKVENTELKKLESKDENK